VFEDGGGDSADGDHTKQERLCGDWKKQLLWEWFVGDAFERDAEEKRERKQHQSAASNGSMQNIFLCWTWNHCSFTHLDSYVTSQQYNMARQSPRRG